MRLAIVNDFVVRYPRRKKFLLGSNFLSNTVSDTLAYRIAMGAMLMTKESVRDAFTDINQQEHRREHLGTVDGIAFINDSKACSINATWFTLETTDGPIIWITGGVDKGNDYSEVLEVVKEKVVAIVCIGDYDEKIRKAFSPVISTIEKVKSMRQAVTMAHKLAMHGNTVLLSPACASFDVFENYEDRGRQFREEVKLL